MDIRLSKIAVKLMDFASGGTRVLFRLRELEIPRGSKILIEGSSGQGKTTLLHLIAGLLIPDEGEVAWGDEIISRLDDEQRARLRRARIGMVFQRLNLIDYLTARENVLLALAKRGADPRVADHALDAVGLKGRYDDRSAVLSLGEQQRVAVARVLAARPEIILADEPTSSLDARNAAAVSQALFDAAKDRTLVVVSHDPRLEPRFDRVIRFEELVTR